MYLIICIFSIVKGESGASPETSSFLPAATGRGSQSCNCDRSKATHHRNSVVISNNGHTSACTRLQHYPPRPNVTGSAAGKHHHVHATLSHTPSATAAADRETTESVSGEVVSIKHHSSPHMCSASVPNHNNRSNSASNTAACR